jgi:two-component system sensor histidine kinase VanS
VPDRGRDRRPGLSVRLKLTLSYAGFLVVAGAALFACMFLVLRYLPDENIVVAQDGGFAPNRSDLLEVAVPLALYGLAFLAVVGLAGGWVLAGRMLRPLGPISEAAQAAAQGSLAHRIALAGPDDEFRRLADVFDDMLGRLERSFEEQRRFTANASHELRTPLAVSKTMLQVARADPSQDRERLLDRLAETIERAAGILDSLLRLAQLDRTPIELDHCDLRDVVRESLRLPADDAAPAGVAVETALEPADVCGDRVLLVQLTDNLLRNAIGHNLPTGGLVRVRTLTGPDGGAVLAVENTGERLEPEVVETLTQPFVRAHARTRAPGRAPGSGLGLALVASIAEAHGARLTLHPREEGGLLAQVRFPPPR